MSIFHEATGDGPAVLLTHGFAASSQMWAATVAPLASDHTAIVWDQLGHARSDSPEDPASYAVAASLDAMTGILDAERVDDAVLVGHSLGGYLSLELALAHPQRVRGLVLVDTGPGYRSEPGRDQWNEMAEGFARTLDDDGLAGLARISGSAEVDSGLHRSAAGLGRSARGVLKQTDGHVMEDLSSITVPTLVIVGGRDQPFLAGSEYMAKKIPGARLAVIDGAGHAPPVTHPQEFNRVLRSFLEEL
ncbi:MAG: alpha/beta fold hydrolase [Ilumatobacteraceae bacterium]